MGQHGEKGDCILVYMQESDCIQKVSPSSGYASAFKKQKSNKKNILMLWGRGGGWEAVPHPPYLTDSIHQCLHQTGLERRLH